MIRTSTPSCRGIMASTIIGLGAFSISGNAFASTYQVGPNRPFHQIGDVAALLHSGDVVEVDGDANYSSVTLSKSGTAQAKITIRGVLRNGKRPAIKGGTNTIALNGSHYVLEGLDVSAGTSRCIFHHGDDITIRDSVVHDCPAQGILGADTGSGSLTLERVEVYRSGQGTRKHQIYIATDEKMYPNAVFRMQYCYVHDGNGGNNVKSRAGRNEIYYNWIEGAMYHELELIGSEEFDVGVLREDSDVVGNVLRKTQGSFVTRLGGDGSGETNGRYRFVNNTIVTNAATKAVFRLFDGLESVEMHNNVFAGATAGAVTLIRSVEAKWAKGHPIIGGSNNWVPTGTTAPSQWTNTRVGSNPGFANVGAYDFTPTQGSGLLDAGNVTPSSPAEAPFPNPLNLPLFMPPARKLDAPRTRVNNGNIDIGAIEAGTGVPTKQDTSLQEEAEQEVAGAQELEVALKNAGSSWDSMACSVNRGGSPIPTVPITLAGFVALVVFRRRQRR